MRQWFWRQQPFGSSLSRTAARRLLDFARSEWILLSLLCAFTLTMPARAETPWTLVKAYPHDPTAFTEGLFYLDGALYESTGLEGQSEICLVSIPAEMPAISLKSLFR